MARTPSKLFGELRSALQDALRCERGRKIDLRVTAIPKPARNMPTGRIRKIRDTVASSGLCRCSTDFRKTLAGAD
jgi:hypothetical protein